MVNLGLGSRDSTGKKCYEQPLKSVEPEEEAMSRTQGLVTGTDTEGSSEALPEGLTNDSSKL